MDYDTREAEKSGNPEGARGRGRPSLPDNSAKARTVKLSPDAHFAAKRNALLLGKTAAEYVSELVLDAPAPPDLSPPARGEVKVRTAASREQGDDRGPCAEHATAPGLRRPAANAGLSAGAPRSLPAPTPRSVARHGSTCECPECRATQASIDGQDLPAIEANDAARAQAHEREGMHRGAPGGMAARAWRGDGMELKPTPAGGFVDDGVPRLGGLPGVSGEAAK